MKFGKTFKKVLQTPQARVSLVLVAVCCVLAFVFASLVSDRSFSTVLQVGCCLVAVFACQRFGQIVVQVQNEEEDEKKK